MRKRLYLANPYGFSAQARATALPTLVEALEATGVEVWEPFARSDLLDRATPGWAYRVAQADTRDVRQADALFAVVNGCPPDEGVMVELGLAIAWGKPTFLFRDDFRRCTDSDVYPLNLMLFAGLPETDWESYWYSSVREVADPDKALARWLRESQDTIEPTSRRVFLSYPTANQDLVENFADRLLQYGVKAWVYSIDKTLSHGTWPEIEARIDEADLFVFVASEDSLDAEGQHRELQRAIERIGRNGERAFKLLPIVIGDLSFGGLPAVLQRVNGLRLDVHTVASTAHELARTFFPNLLGDARARAWHCPKPGQWLEVHHVAPGIEQYLERKDLLYFRRLSPMGLFECYSPKLNDLFWIMPENVRACDMSPGKYPNVPREFSYATSFEDEMRGHDMRRAATDAAQGSG